jgi:hypothetical protein
MKKNNLGLTIVFLCLSLVGIGQNNGIEKSKLFNKSVKGCYHSILEETPVNTPTLELPKNTKATTAHTETLIGNSYYDLQTNSVLGERSYMANSGEMAFVWNMSLSGNSNFSDRGTGYVYNNGGSWGEIPYERLEDFISGWPSIDQYLDGEVITSHGLTGSYNDLGLMIRSQRGSGTWSVVDKGTSLSNIEYVWSRLATSGDNNSIIHVISNTFNEHNGQEKALVYNRTLDGGSTWVDEDVVLEGLGSEFLHSINADDYKIIAKGNTVVILLSSPWMDLFYLKSDDNGQTWEKNIVWEHPYPLFDFATTITNDTIWAPDGSLDAAIDNNGDVHLVFGLTRVTHIEAGTTYNYFPVTDGIVYWNEDMNPFEDPDNQHDALSYDNLSIDQKIGWVPDLNGNGEFDILENITVYPTLGLSTMPSICIDDSDNVFVTWAAQNETIYISGDDGEVNNHHIFGRAYSNGYWGNIVHVTDDVVHSFDECIYPDIIGLHNGYVHMTYWKDVLPGLHLREQHQLIRNDLIYSRIEYEDFGVEENVEAHFEPVWSGNPYQPMTVIVNGATILGVDAVAGDEIGIFDLDEAGNEICVGTGSLESILSASNTLAITTSLDDPDTPEIDGFTSGNDLIIKVYDQDVAKEYSIVTVEFNENLDMVFTPLGTALLSIDAFSHFMPNWSGNPYQPMTLLVNSATLEEISFVPGDEIGVFDLDTDGNVLCVGVGFIDSEISEANPLIIQLSKDDPETAQKDGFTDGNELLYMIYDESENYEYENIEAVYNQDFDVVFTSLGTGIVDLEVITTIEQTLDLNAGWNIISFNNQPEDMFMLNILQPLITEESLIKVIDESGGFIQNIPGVGWMNTIGDMSNTEGYYVKCNVESSFSTIGSPLEYPYTIPLNSGWNIMGFPSVYDQNAIQVLQPVINDGSLIKVISESGGFIQNIPGVGWMNTIGNFVPGHGYYIKVSSLTNLIINNESCLPESKSVYKKATEFIEPKWLGNPYMPMHVVLTDMDESGLMPGAEIGVFSNSECVGASVYEGDKTLVIVVGMDDDNEFMKDDFVLKYHDNSSQQLIDLDVVGAHEMKLEGLSTWEGRINSGDLTNEAILYQNVPNPFINQTEISFYLPEDGFVQLSLINSLGQVVKVLENRFFVRGKQRAVYDLPTLPSGVYNCQLVFSCKDKKQVLNTKIVKHF